MGHAATHQATKEPISPIPQPDVRTRLEDIADASDLVGFRHRGQKGSPTEGWTIFNRRRRHSTLGGVNPAEFERRYGSQIAAVCPVSTSRDHSPHRSELGASSKGATLAEGISKIWKVGPIRPYTGRIEPPPG
jgi:hypothetical protein